MKHFVLSILLLVIPSCVITPQPAFAHAPVELPKTIVSEEFSKRCFTHAVRASWGAVAYTRGAPEMFKYVDLETMKKYFYNDPSAPTDGIYLASTLSMTEVQEAQASTLQGYTVARLWTTETAPKDFQTSVARFFDACVNPK